MKRIRKHHVIAVLEAHNKHYRQETGSERALYLTGTLNKRYSPSMECNVWSIGRGFGRAPRILGDTLKSSYERLTS